MAGVNPCNCKCAEGYVERGYAECYVDIYGYFQKKADRDGKLSWEAVKNAPLSVTDDKGKVIATEVIHKSEFSSFQSKYLDNDPERLNFTEFRQGIKGMRFVSSELICHDINLIPAKYSKLPRCCVAEPDTEKCIAEDDNYPAKEAEAKALEVRTRQVIVEGLARVIRDSWEIEKASVTKLLDEGKFTDADISLHVYLEDISRAAAYDIPVVKTCIVSPLSAPLLQIEALSSPNADKNEVVSNFRKELNQFAGRIDAARKKEAAEAAKKQPAEPAKKSAQKPAPEAQPQAAPKQEEKPPEKGI